MLEKVDEEFIDESLCVAAEKKTFRVSKIPRCSSRHVTQGRTSILGGPRDGWEVPEATSREETESFFSFKINSP